MSLGPFGQSRGTDMVLVPVDRSGEYVSPRPPSPPPPPGNVGVWDESPMSRLMTQVGGLKE